MSQYLSPVDYLLLVLQGVLSLAVLMYWQRFPFYTLRVWAVLSLLQVPAWWIIAARATAEHYGDVFTRVSFVEGVILSACAVEIGAAMLPEHRRQVWQRGPVCIAVAIVAGVILAGGHIMTMRAWMAETNIVTGTALAVGLSCLFIADRAGRFYQIGRAFCVYLAGQLIAVQVPAWLNCDTPECLTSGSMAAAVARRTGPVIWAVCVAGLIFAGSARKNRVTFDYGASAGQG